MSAAFEGNLAAICCDQDIASARPRALAKVCWGKYIQTFP
jgi:hypothetical protein